VDQSKRFGGTRPGRDGDRCWLGGEEAVVFAVPVPVSLPSAWACTVEQSKKRFGGTSPGRDGDRCWLGEEEAVVSAVAWAYRVEQ